jgi:hypothetical protein
VKFTGGVTSMQDSGARIRIREGRKQRRAVAFNLQGFSINAPERCLDDPRNSLTKHHLPSIADLFCRFAALECVLDEFA